MNRGRALRCLRGLESCACEFCVCHVEGFRVAVYYGHFVKGDEKVAFVLDSVGYVRFVARIGVGYVSVYGFVVGCYMSLNVGHVLSMLVVRGCHGCEFDAEVDAVGG